VTTSAIKKISSRIRPAFIIALVISTLLWISLSLSEEAPRTISIPFEPIPDTGLAIVNNYPDQINFVIRATGYEFSNIPKNRSLTLNFNESMSNLVTNTEIEELIKDQLGISASQIVRINFRDINFEFDTLFSKQFEIADSLIKFNIPNGFILKDNVEFSSDSFLLSGPSLQIRDLDHWNPFSMDLGKISKNTSGEVRLSPPIIPNVTIVPEMIQYKILLEKAIEKTIEVDIAVDNPTSYNFEIAPNKVLVKFLVGLSRFDSLGSDDFQIKIEVKDSTSRCPIQIINQPSKIKGLSVFPDSIDVLLTKS
jgi:hypothetical protein